MGKEVPVNMPRNTIKTKTAGILVATLLIFGAMPAISAAQSPTDRQYDPKTISFEDRTGDPGDGGLNNSVGPLPFTGFDVIAMLAVALAVTGLGLALQRAVSREPKDLR